MARTLANYLSESGTAPELVKLLETVADGCVKISKIVRRGALADILGSAGTGNIQGEEQKKLDVLANDVLLEVSRNCGVLAGAASEEEDDPVWFEGAEAAPYLLTFDPLDGSSNIDVNVSIGTIFSILPSIADKVGEGHGAFLQAGRNQAASGYAVYGPQTCLVLTLGKGNGVVSFTLDPDTNNWEMTADKMEIPAATKEFSINMSNMRHWADPVSEYIAECLAGETGPRGKNFNMRWVAAMVSDVHRIISRGGVFMYPWDKRDPNKPGKLRLMYEANPMSLLVEEAGGRSFNGEIDILDVKPEGLHQRVSVMLGSKEEVDVLEAKHKA